MKKGNIIGWIGVGITLLISGIWSYWGTFEFFHEGTYAVSFWENVFMFFFQYMLFAFVFMILALVSLQYKKIGLVLHIALGLFAVYFFNGANFTVLGLMIVIPFALLGVLYFFGEPKPKKWAYRLVILIPLIIMVAISIPQGIKISKRVDDGDYGMRIVEGNGVTLAWAPRGPGWPDEGISWDEANEICTYLSEDGTTIMDTPQNIWRLPTVDEAVRSMMLHGENAGGVWNAYEETATYEMTPDKESPLWDIHSKVIYYWTADTSRTTDTQAYIIVYHGGVYDRIKTNSQSYLSFRAVKEVDMP